MEGVSVDTCSSNTPPKYYVMYRLSTYVGENISVELHVTGQSAPVSLMRDKFLVTVIIHYLSIYLGENISLELYVTDRSAPVSLIRQIPCNGHITLSINLSSGEH